MDNSLFFVVNPVVNLLQYDRFVQADTRSKLRVDD
uniref:Uncharacterized protein n=1 Tax=Siphoviridae sp. ctsYA13 TaxID=2825695 RepID=A0A8S5VBZ6_9CAUD|nr:MAG TPA: hypothetical protein [Siphoviridae sp. ctsYA13]